MTKRIGIYAGSFDPLTFGHIDIIRRASRLFDELIVLIAVNTSKKSLFVMEERRQMIQEALGEIDNVVIDSLQDGLIADYYKKVKATSLVRGVRSTQDFEYESQIALVNRAQDSTVETLLLLANEKYRYLSSSLIKEIAYFEGDITAMVPQNVVKAMQKKMKEQRQPLRNKD